MNDALQVTGNTEHSRPENLLFYPALDGLRTLAFLMVFLHHYDSLPWGWAGVDLFFVLSGFLITGILYDTRNDPFRARNFYIRRTLRIFPLFYGVMLLLALTRPWAHWQWSLKWIIWPLYVGNFMVLHLNPLNSSAERLAFFEPYGLIHGHLIVLNLGHFWSLCVEEQFYLVWPWLVFWIGNRRKLMWICALTVPACLIARMVGQHFAPSWLYQQGFLVRFSPFRVDDLLLGGLLALLMRSPSKATALRAARWLLPPSLVVALLLIALVCARRIPVAAYPYPGWLQTGGFTLIALLSFLLIATAVQTGTWLYFVFSWRPLRWAGRITYGAYVFHDIAHQPLYFLGTRLHMGARFQIPFAVLCLTYLAAWLSFRFVETPFLKLKDRWTVRSHTSAGPGSHQEGSHFASLAS